MNILVIGNGFDIAHDLPTKYEHFLKYIDAFKRHKTICEKRNDNGERENADVEDRDYIKHFTDLYDNEPQIYQEINDLTKDNVWIEYFWKIYKNRTTPEKDGWIDFESEISRIIQTLDEARHTLLEQFNQGQELGRMTQQQINTLYPVFGKPIINRNSIEFDKNAVGYRKTQLLKTLNGLTRCLELYLSNYVEEMSPEVRLPDITRLRPKLQYILSFNYTHTYDRLYSLPSMKIKYDYIHGEAKGDSNIEKCNLILGIDEYLEGKNRDRDNEFIQFKKFYQRIYKKTGCKYVDWVSNANQIPMDLDGNGGFRNNVYIFGHSLDITDKDTLSALINMKSTKTTIFYHDRKALGNYISNLVKILGEEELIARVHGENASIVLQKQQAAIPKKE